MIWCKSLFDESNDQLLIGPWFIELPFPAGINLADRMGASNATLWLTEPQFEIQSPTFWSNSDNIREMLSSAIYIRAVYAAVQLAQGSWVDFSIGLYEWEKFMSILYTFVVSL
jgi:hypothetical protein